MLIEPGVFLLRLRSRAAIGCADDAPVRVVGQRLGDADVVDNCVVVGHGLDDESAPIRLRSRGGVLMVDNCVVVGHGLDDESAPIRLRSRGGVLMRPALVFRKLKGGVLRDDEAKHVVGARKPSNFVA